MAYMCLEWSESLIDNDNEQLLKGFCVTRHTSYPMVFSDIKK